MGNTHSIIAFPLLTSTRSEEPSVLTYNTLSTSSPSDKLDKNGNRMIHNRLRLLKASDCISEYLHSESARVAFVFERWWALTDRTYTRRNG